MGKDCQVEDLDEEIVSDVDEYVEPKSRKLKAKEHKSQLEKLREKDPEFYKFLEENDKDLLAFDDEGFEDDDAGTDMDERHIENNEESNDQSVIESDEKQSTFVINTAIVEAWCKSIREDGKIGALRNLMKAFRLACHYGDDDDESSKMYHIMSSNVFNKIMVFVLNEMDGILRKLLGLPASGGQKQTLIEISNTRKWKNYSHFVKSYLGNALHVLNQMTDTEMVAFTLRRLKNSALLLGAFPSLHRKYIKVVLHFWGTGSGSLPIVAFLFLRDLCVRLGPDLFHECIKGMYKAYVLNCQFINSMKLQHIILLGNCVTELIRVDVSSGYHHGFVFIRQLAAILRDAITMKTKESFRKVYEWKFISCLELWTGAVCALSNEADFKLLAYPLTQVITGAARLVPTARYFPLRMRCVRMLNRIAAATGSYIPISTLLVGMLDMKELKMPPTKGLGNSVDLRAMLKVPKPIMKTRAFQEACVSSVVEELTNHLALWSYSPAFLELSFVPGVRLRNFTKSTKVDRFRKEIRHLIRQIEDNVKFVNEKRMSITFRPNDPAAETFLEAERLAGLSPLSQYYATLQQKAQQRGDALAESSVIVGEHASTFSKKLSENEGDDGAANVFSSDWIPDGKSKVKLLEEKRSKKRKKGTKETEDAASDEDIVEDLILSSEEDDDEPPVAEKKRPVAGGKRGRKSSENGKFATISVKKVGRKSKNTHRRKKKQKSSHD